MKLKYITTPLSEGGAAVPGCGTIHISEISSTLTRISADLELPIDLNDYTIGSTGKSEYSGDMDVIIDRKWWCHDIPAFREKLIKIYTEANVRRNGDTLHLKYPISFYDKAHQLRGPRTGYVQVDFNFGDVMWETFYHYSAGDESGYKGAHRNLAIGSLCATVDVTRSTDTDSLGRSISTVRWRYGQKGFVRVIRNSVQKNGVWLKKQTDTETNTPTFDPYIVSRILFPEDGLPDDLNSVESIMDAVHRNYPPKKRELIWERMAINFYQWKDGRNFSYPQEISKYLPNE